MGSSKFEHSCPKSWLKVPSLHRCNPRRPRIPIWLQGASSVPVWNRLSSLIYSVSSMVAIAQCSSLYTPFHPQASVDMPFTILSFLFFPCRFSFFGFCIWRMLAIHQHLSIRINYLSGNGLSVSENKNAPAAAISSVSPSLFSEQLFTRSGRTSCGKTWTKAVYTDPGARTFAKKINQQ